VGHEYQQCLANTVDREASHMANPSENGNLIANSGELDSIIEQYATAKFDDSTPLLDAGIESLSLLRLAVEVAADADAEIDATRLVELRTIADLKSWLREIAFTETTEA
jgi:acyl carrier protein